MLKIYMVEWFGAECRQLLLCKLRWREATSWARKDSFYKSTGNTDSSCSDWTRVEEEWNEEQHTWLDLQWYRHLFGDADQKLIMSCGEDGDYNHG